MSGHKVFATICCSLSHSTALICGFLTVVGSGRSVYNIELVQHRLEIAPVHQTQNLHCICIILDLDIVQATDKFSNCKGTCRSSRREVLLLVRMILGKLLTV